MLLRQHVKVGSIMCRYIFMTLAVSLLLFGCADKEPTAADKYPKIDKGGGERKSGPAMLFYEQAEKDADLTDSVIVIPPKEKKE